jgi:hypothetical protein
MQCYGFVLIFSFFEAKKRNEKALKNFHPTSARKWPTLLLRHTPPRQFFALPIYTSIYLSEHVEEHVVGFPFIILS